MVNHVGQRLGNYQLIRWLGSGSFADVYLGEHIHLEVPASIKVLRLRMRKDESELFLQEARLVARLRHPHIIQVFDFDIIDGTPFLVMEYAPNGTLRSRHAEGRRLIPEQIIVYVKQIASALQYAHEQKVIHRDIKPENILLGLNNKILLSDFGLAVVQQSLSSPEIHSPAGTALYMAPEQIKGNPCAASDQYSLGIMVYEWLCGSPPFRGTRLGVLEQHLYSPVPRLCVQVPTLSPAIEDIVLVALAKDSQQRFTAVQDFADVLEAAYLSTQPLSVVFPGEPVVTVPFELSSTITPPQTAGPLAVDISSDSTQPAAPDMPHPPTAHPQPPASSPLSPLQLLNRQRLLAKVRSFWIKGVLEQSLHGEALITLGLGEQADAVANPWKLVVCQPDTSQSPLPAGTTITQVYDGAGGELLILGAPGSGKTTLLLELARNLLDRAERNEHHPLPVVFNLSSWTVNRPLIDWLIEELNSKYQVPRKLAQLWVNTDQVLPLLDGLDEVPPVQRTACIEAINAYRQEHGLVPIVVCSRTADYLAQTTHVLLQRAVVVQPLNAQQIDEYLAQAGQQMEAVRKALDNDEALQELATTPLMLSILTLAYHGIPARDLLTAGSREMRRQHIFEQYVRRMLDRRGTNTSYTPQQTMQWLAWLAQQLIQHNNQKEFYLERMQADWLPAGRLRQLYLSIAPRLLSGPVGGLVGGLVFLLISFLVAAPGTGLGIRLVYGLFYYGLIGVLVGVLIGGRKTDATPTGRSPQSQARVWRSFARAEHLKNGLLAGLVYGLSGALVGLIAGGLQAGLVHGLIFGLLLVPITGSIGVLIGVLVSVLTSKRKAEITPAEVVNWSRTSMWRSFTRVEHLRNGLFAGLVVGLVNGLGVGLAQGLRAGLIYGLGGGFIGLVVCWLVYGLFGGLSSDILDKRRLVRPNQGIWRSARNALLIALTSGLVIGLVFGIAFALVDRLIFGHADILSGALLSGLLAGLGGGLLSGLLGGGDAWIKHFVLRFLLWRAKLVPWNYPRFLDYTVKQILLRRVGGGYIFIHQLLLEYFASLNVTRAFMHNEGETVQDTSSGPTQPL